MIFGKRLFALTGASSSAGRHHLHRHHRHASTALQAARGGGAQEHGDGDDCPKLSAIRQELRDRGLDAMVVVSDDPHLSEYVAPCFARREFASGFTGSAGTIVVTQTEAKLWTDGRYWLQAENELSSEWGLMRAGESGVPSLPDWLGASGASVVGIDATVTSASLAASLRAAAAKSEMKVEAVDGNPVDSVWGSERPATPNTMLRVHPIEYAGESVTSKLKRVRYALKDEKSGALVVAALDEVCWLLNIRGADVECNPVGFSFALVKEDSATVFVDSSKLTPEVAAHLKEAGVQVDSYDNAIAAVEQCTEKVWLDMDRVADAFVAAVADDRRLLKRSPIALMKAVKNKQELAGMYAAHIRDGAAAVRGFAEIEERVRDQDGIDEVDVDLILTARRMEDAKFLDLSFPTIAGAGPNGAIIHYGAMRPEASEVKPGMLLVDSGAQYTDGTTDVTRTWHFGEPTDLERLAYTNVLKGNIMLDSTVFPENTPGFVLDAFARRALWRSGQDYGHGTGHGVGAALSVHEGPQSISPRWANTEPLRAGMIVSNEPGLYERDAFGVRIENLLVVEYDGEPVKGKKRFLRFSKLTHIPIDRTAVDMSLLDDAEIKWIDGYHADVLRKIAPLVKEDERATKWLKAKCAPFTR